MIELASMFQDLAVLVEQQEVAVQAAEQNAENTQKWTEEGNVHVGKGIKSARNRRKLKWWCLLVTILIIIIVAAVAAGVYSRLYIACRRKLTTDPQVSSVRNPASAVTPKFEKTCKASSTFLHYTQTMRTMLFSTRVVLATSIEKSTSLFGGIGFLKSPVLDSHT